MPGKTWNAETTAKGPNGFAGRRKFGQGWSLGDGLGKILCKDRLKIQKIPKKCVKKLLLLSQFLSELGEILSMLSFTPLNNIGVHVRTAPGTSERDMCSQI